MILQSHFWVYTRKFKRGSKKISAFLCSLQHYSPWLRWKQPKNPSMNVWIRNPLMNNESIMNKESINEENVTQTHTHPYIHNAILFSQEKEEKPTICKSIDIPFTIAWMYYVNWNKLEKGIYCMVSLTCAWWGGVKLIEREGGKVVARAVGWGKLG